MPGTVEANLRSKHSSIKQGEHVQKLSSTFCNQLNYTIYTKRHYEVLDLKVQHILDVRDSNSRFN